METSLRDRLERCTLRRFGLIIADLTDSFISALFKQDDSALTSSFPAAPENTFSREMRSDRETGKENDR